VVVEQELQIRQQRLEQQIQVAEVVVLIQDQDQMLVALVEKEL
jgi:hypothetical protein